MHFETLSIFTNSKPIERLISDLDHIAQRLARAHEIAIPWVGRVGGDPELRGFIKNLDFLLFRNVGQGLVRTSQPKRGRGKPRGGTACLEFVESVARLAYGEGAFTADAIDDAVKDVIKFRRHSDVGRIPQKKGQSVP